MASAERENGGLERSSVMYRSKVPPVEGQGDFVPLKLKTFAKIDSYFSHFLQYLPKFSS